MKKTITLLVLLHFSFFIFSQKKFESFGLSLGGNYFKKTPNISNYYTFKYSLNTQLGVFSKFSLRKNIVLNTGFNYLLRNNIEIAQDLGFNIKARYHFVSLPLSLQFTPLKNKKISFLLEAEPAMLSRIDFISNGMANNNVNLDLLFGKPTYDLFLTSGLGYTIKKIQFNLQYSYGISTLDAHSFIDENGNLINRSSVFLQGFQLVAQIPLMIKNDL